MQNKSPSLFQLIRSIYNVNIAGFYLIIGYKLKAFKLNKYAQSKLQNTKNWRVTTARCYNNLGKIYFSFGRYEKAIKWLKLSADIFTEKKKTIYIGLCNQNIGLSYSAKSDYDNALKYLDFSIKNFEDCGEVSLKACSQKEIADVYSKFGQYEKAIELLYNAREVLSLNKLYRAETAYCDFYLGKIYEETFNYEKALEFYLSSRKIISKCGETIETAKCDISIAYVYFLRDQIDVANQFIKSAKILFQKENDEIGLLDCKFLDGKIKSKNQQYENAIEAFKSAEKGYEKNQLNIKATLCVAETASIYSQLGDFDKASHLNSAAENNLKNIENSTSEICVNKLRLLINFNKANILFRLGEYERSIEIYETIKETIDFSSSPKDTANCDFNIASANMFLGEYEKAKLIFRSVRRFYSQCDFPKETDLCDLNIAVAEMALGNIKNAYFKFKILGNSVEYSIRARSFFGISNIYKNQGSYKHAIDFCKRAIEEVEKERDTIIDDDLRCSYLGTVFDFYYAIIDNTTKLSDFETALEYIERLKCRKLAEMLSNRVLFPNYVHYEDKMGYINLKSKIRAHLQLLKRTKHSSERKILYDNLEKLNEELFQKNAFFQSTNPNFNPVYNESISYDEMRSLCKKIDAPIVELFPMGDKIIVFILQKELDLRKSTIVIEDLNQLQISTWVLSLIEKYYSCQNSTGSERSHLKSEWENELEKILEVLHEKLFLKIKPLIEGFNKITFVPYGVLHYIPFHALYYKKNDYKRYLIDDFQITYAPSLTVLKHLSIKNETKARHVILTYANPTNENSSLPYAIKEINEIKLLFDNSTVITKATKRDFTTNCKDAAILHYAGHANYNSLILHKETDPDEKHEYTVEDIYESLDLPKANLVTLSACETGMIIPKGADEYFGLASGFIHAGAATVISSLWSVSDISTSLLMKKMYSLIKIGYGKSEALRHAQLWLKDSKNNDEHREMCRFMNSERTTSSEHENRGFSVESYNWEEIVPTDFSHPVFWAAFICSGVP